MQNNPIYFMYKVQYGIYCMYCAQIPQYKPADKLNKLEYLPNF